MNEAETRAEHIDPALKAAGYFTIYDFVKAHHHFNDPEWDGEPIEVEAKES